MLFSEVSEGFNAYGVGHHRHMAELDQELPPLPAAQSSSPSPLTSCPATGGFFHHLCPQQHRLGADLHAMLAKGYANEPFVHVLPLGAVLHTCHVRGSNMTFIGLVEDRIAGRVVICSALGQPAKGASGQAVQNMNPMLGFPETLGLEQVALFPARPLSLRVAARSWNANSAASRPRSSRLPHEQSRSRQ